MTNAPSGADAILLWGVLNVKKRKIIVISELPPKFPVIHVGDRIVVRTRDNKTATAEVLGIELVNARDPVSNKPVAGGLWIHWDVPGIDDALIKGSTLAAVITR